MCMFCRDEDGERFHSSCYATVEDGNRCYWNCTRELGHRGQHVACSSYNHIIIRWCGESGRDSRTREVSRFV